MTVESRFDINDNVWRMFRNKPHQGTISGVFIYIVSKSIKTIKFI